MTKIPQHRIRRAGLQAGAAATLMAAFALPASAQFRASIQGTVTDSTGGVIPNATLILLDTDTNRSITATSNESGTYNFNALAPDHYSLTATAPGFQQQVIKNVQINPEQANSVNVSMNPGDVATVVNVQGDLLPTLDTETASINGNVDSNQIQHLPSSGRDVFQLVQLAPGVFADGARAAGGGGNATPGNQGPSSGGSGIFATENGPQANSNGGQYGTNGISIDGISTVSAVWGGTSVITPSEDSVGNVKIVSNQYDAENGRFSGAQIQITSKTGSNDFHGSAYFRAQRPGLNAYQRWNGPGTYDAGTPTERGLIRESTRANQIGGSIGGPIWKDHVFAFFSYETQRDNSSVPANSWFETPQFRSASGGAVAAVYNGFSGAAPAGASLINQSCAAAGLVDGRDCRQIAGQGLDIGSPLRNGAGAQDPTYVSSTQPGVGSGLDNVADVALYQTQNPTDRVGEQYNGRIDADVTKKDHIAFAIYWVPLTVTNYQGTVRTYNLWHHNQINDAYSGIWNHVFSPSLLNEARFNDAGWRWNEVASNPQAPFGLPSSQVDAFGSLTGGNQLSAFGAANPSNFNQHSYTYKDIATKVIGNHTIKFGGELNRIYYLNNPVAAARPNFNFYNVWNFLNDAPHAENGQFDASTGVPFANRQDNRENLWGGFVQDSWKARPNLTLNVGLRYSYFGAFYSKQNNLGVAVLPSGPNMFTDLSIRRGGSLTSPQTANVAPQFGFSYAPPAFQNKMVIRGGYGLNFNQTEIANIADVAFNPPFVFNANFNSSTPTAADPRIRYGVATSPNSLFGYAPNPNATGGYNAAGLPVSGGVQVNAYQQRPPTIYTQHYSLDTQIDLGHQLVATIGYQGSVTRHLAVRAQLYVNAFAEGVAQNPLINNVTTFVNSGSSNNNSLLVGLKHQMAHNFQFDAEFNYSRSMDTGSGPYYTDPYPYRPDLAYGRSDFDVNKFLKVYGLWQPKFFAGHGLASSLLDGWSFSGIYNMHSGFPFTANYNVPGGQLYYSGSGYSQLRPAALLSGFHKNRSNSAYKDDGGNTNLNFPGNVAFSTDSSLAASPYFINPIAPVASSSTGFATGLPQLPGVSRNSFTGPGYLDVDATVAKNFGFPKLRGLGEAAGLEIRADAFNLFNNVNLNASNINTNILTATFGQSNRALSGRTVNLQARFNF